MLKHTPNWTLLFFAAFALVGCGKVSSESALEEGDQLLREYEYGLARKLFNLAREEHQPASPEWIQATYGQALAAWHQFPAKREFNEEAASLFEELLVSEGVNSTLRARIKLNLGRIYEVRDYPGDVIDVAKAREYYTAVMDSHGDSSLGYEAMLRLASTHEKEVTEEGFRTAVTIIENFLNQAPTIESWTSVSWQRIGDIKYEFLNDTKGGLAAYQEAKTLGFVNPIDASTYIWLMANMAEEVGDLSLAREYYSEIVSDYLRSSYQFLSKKRIAEIDAELKSSGPDKTEGPS